MACGAGAMALRACSAALLLLLLAGCAEAGPTAIVAGGAAAGQPLSPPHVVFACECSPYMDWQSLTVVRSYRKMGGAGPITR